MDIISKQRIIKLLVSKKYLAPLLKILWRLYGTRVKGRGAFNANGWLKRCRISVHEADSSITIIDPRIVDKLEIEIKGNNNHITIEPGCIFEEGTRIAISGKNCNIKIGKSTVFKATSIYCYDDSSVIKIGANCSFESNSTICAMEGKSIYINDGCLCSYYVEIRNSDGHSILNQNHMRINTAKNITVGKNVWISQRVLILKGAVIGDDCVIGANSLVTSHIYSNNSIIIGQPAKTIKNNITWIEKRITGDC